MNKGRFGKLMILILALAIVALVLTACEIRDPDSSERYFINDNTLNETFKNNTTRDSAIDRVTNGITALRSYLDNEVVSSTGYYMGVEFNIDTRNPDTDEGGNFRLKIQAHLYTYQYLDEEGNHKTLYKEGSHYYEEQNAEGTRIPVDAEELHNQLIKQSDVLIEWYNGATNEMLIGFYFDGENANSDDPGNILYLNIQGAKRSFPDFGDTVLYRQLIRLLMNLSVEKLLVSGGIQGDAGVSSIRSLFEVAVTDNYQVVLNESVYSTLFYSLAASAIADTITDFIQGMFRPFEDKIDPLTFKYLGFKFSVMGSAIINSVTSDMQFFTQPDPQGLNEIMTGAFLTFTGAAASGGAIFNYTSDVTFEYGAYPPEDMKLDRDYYVPYEYGKYEFVGNLYVPLMNSNFDALIRTDMQQYDNTTNNVFMEFRDIANGELMIGGYYRYERTFIDISGLEYLYGWIDLNQLGFPKVYDESLDLANALAGMFRFFNDSIVSIVDAILSPNKNDKENHLLEEIMAKTSKTEKDPNDIFSKNTVTLTVDVDLVKKVLEETGNGTYTTRQLINILDSMLPYSMDQIAIMLGVANAEIMLEETYFTFTLNVDTNEITIKMFTNVGREENEDSLLIFQLDITPVIVGQHVDIANVDFSGFKPLEQIYTYSATMNGNFVFSANEQVELSKLLSATIGENSGLNTPYRLDPDVGLTFRLVYDQYVTDQEVDGVMHKQGRSAFELTVWLTGMEQETIITIASDDVAFNSDVYGDQPARAAELGYVWVNIAGVKEGGYQKIPPIKIREDIFMSSMQAYMNGTSISDTAANLGNSEINLSITSILFALVEDAYVVMEPEQMEITSSNETLQNLFRVHGLIGNIRVDAGFRYRVDNLAGSKSQYGMYKVGEMFQRHAKVDGNDMGLYAGDMVADHAGSSPYNTSLHNFVYLYFYDDFSLPENGGYGWLDYDFRVNPDGRIQVYHKGGKVSVMREPITYTASDSFFNNEDTNNQDITKVMFPLESLPFITVNDGRYCYFPYDVVIPAGTENIFEYATYISEDGIYVDGDGKTYVYYLAVADMLEYEGDESYAYYVDDMAVRIDGQPVYIYPTKVSDFLFEYDRNSIEITEAEKTQYAPRINGSYMGEIRRYILQMNTTSGIELGKLVELAAGNPDTGNFYSEEDRTNTEEIYDDDGILVEEVAAPIALFVFEPCEPLPDFASVHISGHNIVQNYSLAVEFDIDWDAVTLDGFMSLTTATIAPGMMGEQSFPIRLIVTNRRIDSLETVSVFLEDSPEITTDIPVVDSIDVDPYDYLIAKSEYFFDTSKYSPARDDYNVALANFVKDFFADYNFTITFDANNSYLKLNDVKDEYVAYSYEKGMDLYDWSFDAYSDGTYTESKIGTQMTNAIYLHTYFHGQLIALEVNFGVRNLVKIKFSEDDDFNPATAEENAGKTAGDPGYIYGHYRANYYDEESYIVGTSPIFVFEDEQHATYEKVFDMRYIDTDHPFRNGQYNIIEHYALTWLNDRITHIGMNGSYYEKEDGEGNKTLVNRPFFEVEVTRDPVTGEITSETTIPTEFDSDITSASINWYRLFSVYRGTESEFEVIPLIAGTPSSNGYMTTELHITVDCPALDVLPGDEDMGTPDNFNEDANFIPDVVDIGGANPGYYDIDPLNEESLEIPTTANIHFGDGEGLEGEHVFSGLQWRVVFDTTVVDGKTVYVGDGNLNNEDYTTRLADETLYDESGNNIGFKRVYRMSNGKTQDGGLVYIIRLEETYDREGTLVSQRYFYDNSTENMLTTPIMARIGNENSGYQYIKIALRVLSKDPRSVEFYYGTIPSAGQNPTGRITSIESTKINDLTGGDTKEYTYYTYYVDTFSGFNLPNFIKATFGSGSAVRDEYYSVRWQPASGREMPFRPDSVVNLKTIIGSGEVTIEIYLSVVVRNKQISEIDLNGTVAVNVSGEDMNVALSSLYVKIGDGSTFVQLADLAGGAFGDNPALWLKNDETGESNSHDILIRISLGDPTADIGYGGVVPLGMIGLYYLNNETHSYEGVGNIYPYDFISAMYSRMTIRFAAEKPVSAENFDVRQMFINTGDSSSSPHWTKISDIVTYGYNARDDIMTISLTTAPCIEDGNVDLLPASGRGESVTYSYYELLLLLMETEKNRDIRTEKIISIRNGAEYITPEGDLMLEKVDPVAGTTERLYSLDENGNLTFTYNGEPLNFTEISFEGGKTLTYGEIVLRLKHLIAHRFAENPATSVTRDRMGIQNLEGIFSINDVVRSVGGGDFTPSEKYIIPLGTGEGAYDVVVRLAFTGGVKYTEENAVVDAILVPYSEQGEATYGVAGYKFDEFFELTGFIAKKQNGAGDLTDPYNYGLLFGNPLSRFYVERSSFAGITVGSFITTIDQQYIYAPGGGGTLTLSALTPEGFRIRFQVTIIGIPEEIQEGYSSVTGRGLAIQNGVVNIDDIYNYMPLATELAGSRLPTTVSLDLGGRIVRISNINWELHSDWTGSYDENGKWINGWVDTMPYSGLRGGNYATAQVLGWFNTADRTYRDVITLVLRIEVQSAQVTELPWATSSLGMDVTTLRTATSSTEGPSTKEIFAVDVDAMTYNTVATEAGIQYYNLPATIPATYSGGLTHNFGNVRYLYNDDIQVTRIPYNNSGIDVNTLARELNVAPSTLSNRSIDLTVDLGLMQVLTIRFRFYDKTIEDVTVIIDMDDEAIRSAITSSLQSVSADKQQELLEQLNLTRITRNIEGLYAAARDMVNSLKLPTYEDVNNQRNNGAQGVIDLLLASWKEDGGISKGEEKYSLADNILSLETSEEKKRKTSPYKTEEDGAVLKNFAYDILRPFAEAEAQTAGNDIFAILWNDNVGNKEASVANLVRAYRATLSTDGFELIIGNYIKLELKRVMRDELLNGNDLSVINGISYYKNIIESAIDYDYIIREFGRIKEYVDSGLVYASATDGNNYAPYYAQTIRDARNKANEEQYSGFISSLPYSDRLYFGVLMTAVDNALDNVAANLAARRSAYSDNLKEIIRKLFLHRAGIIEIDGSRHNMLKGASNDIRSIIGTAVSGETKKGLRQRLRDFFAKAFDFSDFLYDEPTRIKDWQETELWEMAMEVIDINLNAIPYFENGVYRIRYGLSTSSSITSSLETVLTRGITNFVDNLYIESRVAKEIRTAQERNRTDGYFFIDPYSDYRLAPTEVVINFGESDGGYAYTPSAGWINDNVSGYINYRGNKKNDSHGYVKIWREYLSKTGRAREYLDGIYNDISVTVGEKTWTEILAENQALYDTLMVLPTIYGEFYPDGNGDEPREVTLVTLYKYYLAGQRLVSKAVSGTSDAKEELEVNLLHAEDIIRDFDKYRYDELTNRLINPTTGEAQTYSVIAEVYDRSVRSDSVIIEDQEGTQVTTYYVEDPFAFEMSDLPQYVRIPVYGSSGVWETMKVVWNDVSVEPIGNIDATTHTIYGNIGNANGQPVQMELYVARWEFITMYRAEKGADGEYIRGNEMNPIQIFVNPAMEYSLEDVYFFEFKIYEPDGSSKPLDSQPFYPADSKLLLDSEDDEKLNEARERSNYVLYWETLIQNNVLANHLTEQSGSIFFGNAKMGGAANQINGYSLRRLAGKDGNIPKTAYYNYEEFFPEFVDLFVDDKTTDIDEGKVTGPKGEEVNTFSVNGDISFAIDPLHYYTLPRTADIILRKSLTDYDPNEIKVRLLWGKDFEQAVNDLVGFVGQEYENMDSAAMRQKAISILMDDFTENEINDLKELARDYEMSRSPYVKNNEVDPDVDYANYLAKVEKDVEELLMLEERYDFTQNGGSALKGGTVGATVTILIKYGESSYVHSEERNVRLLLADFNPQGYYFVDSSTGNYKKLEGVDGSNLSSVKTQYETLYITVRAHYLVSGEYITTYETENRISPYNALSMRDYMILDWRYSARYADEAFYDDYRLVEVTNIVYEDAAIDGTLRSKSFEINGETYQSNLISLPVI